MKTPTAVDAIVVSGTWPTGNTGYAIAVRSGIAAYLEHFGRLFFFGPGDVARTPEQEEWSQVSWASLPLVRGPLWWRFLRSLPSSDPAVSVRFSTAREAFLRAVSSVVHDAGRRGRGVALIYEDLPAAVLLADVRRAFPRITQVIRSHNILVKGFEGLDRAGPFPSRLAWQLELAKIDRFERRVCQMADRVWAISKRDAGYYRDMLGIEVDGVMGIAVDGDRYRDVPAGDIETVVHVGSADLRKGAGLADFLRLAWPRVRSERPGARLVLAGRGTERFSDPALGVEGLGFVSDELQVLRRGRLFVNPQAIGAGVQLKSIVAMLSARALVSTSVGVSGVEARRGEHFVSAPTVAGLGEIILQLMAEPDEAMAMGQRARALADATYGTERLLRDASSLVRDVIEATEVRHIGG